MNFHFQFRRNYIESFYSFLSSQNYVVVELIKDILPNASYFTLEMEWFPGSYLLIRDCALGISVRKFRGDDIIHL